MNTFASAEIMDDLDLTRLSIGEIQEAFAAGRYTSEMLTRAHLSRIERFEPFYNAFTALNPDALDDARSLDARRAAGEALGPLAGVPVVVKEAMDMIGLPSTGGWAALSSRAGGVDLFPERDASVVARLRAAGAVILGKTNIPAFSHDGARAASSWDGPTFNAVCRAVAPGASSTGTATAVAGGFAVVGLAEETGGSIQNPAAAQSIVGIKPTFGLVPNDGVMPLAGSTRDVVGSHARSVRDAALLLDALAGYTPADPKTVASFGRIPPGGYAAALRTGALRGARIGLYGRGWRAGPLSPEAAALYGQVVANLAAQGAVLVEDPFHGSGFRDLAQGGEGFDARGMESVAYDMETYLRMLGSRSPIRSLADLQQVTGLDPFAPDGVLGRHPPAMPVLRASLERPAVPPDLSAFRDLRERYLALFEAVMTRHRLDALVFPQVSKDLPPVSGTEEFPATTVSEINIAGLPGVTIPAGRFASGAPFGLIIVGRLWSEGDLLAYAEDYEQSFRPRLVPQLEEIAFQTD